MSEYVPEQPTQIDTAFVPQAGEPLSATEALQALELSLEAQPSAVDLVVSVDPPPPIGRSWAFDFRSRSFVTAGSRSPLQTRDLQTLGGWIEKCLNTARGAHPVHPDGYGLPAGLPMIGGPQGALPADLEDRITDALTFHPRITGVRHFAYDYDPDEEWLAVSFTVLVDGGLDELPVSSLELTL